jgi:protocatechuate 3,4-dioxygenase beta subunit
MPGVAAVVLLLGLALQSAGGDPARRPAEAGATISGRVIDKDSGRPLGRALVTLIPAGSTHAREVFADADGRYEFTGLEPGDYAIAAGPGELRATHLRQVFGEADPSLFLPERPRAAIRLKPREIRTAVDLPLTRALAIEGRVLDEAGEPMSDVPIAVLRDGVPHPSNQAASDDRGDYRIYGLPPGRYRVCASVNAGESAGPSTGVRFIRTCHPSATSEAAAADVVLSTSVATSIDIRLQQSGAYTLSGIVLDASGAPARAAFVNARSLDDGGGGHDRIQNDDGRFVIPGITPGSYMLSAALGGPESPDDRRPPARELEMAYVPVDVGGGDVSGLVVQLSKGETIRGRVVFEGGAPPPAKSLAMVVYLGTPFRWRGFHSEWNPPRRAVGDDLTFELTGIFRLPRSVGLSGLPDGWVLKSVRHANRDITGLLTEFGPGSGSHAVEIAVTNRVALPAVHVVDEQGQPAAASRVVLFPVDPGQWKATFPGVSGSESEPGVLPLGPRLPGDYFLAALSWDDYRLLLFEPELIEALATVADRVTFGEGDRRTLEVRVRELPRVRR